MNGGESVMPEDGGGDAMRDWSQTAIRFAESNSTRTYIKPSQQTALLEVEVEES